MYPEEPTLDRQSSGRMFPGVGGHNAYRSKEPQCKNCQKYDGARCGILGEITTEALKACKLAGYWDCYCRPSMAKPAYRVTAHTGVWAEILEER